MIWAGGLRFFQAVADPSRLGEYRRNHFLIQRGSAWRARRSLAKDGSGDVGINGEAGVLHARPEFFPHPLGRAKRNRCSTLFFPSFGHASHDIAARLTGSPLFPRGSRNALSWTREFQKESGSLLLVGPGAETPVVVQGAKTLVVVQGRESPGRGMQGATKCPLRDGVQRRAAVSSGRRCNGETLQLP